jgi:hypothetical protein
VLAQKDFGTLGLPGILICDSSGRFRLEEPLDTGQSHLTVVIGSLAPKRVHERRHKYRALIASRNPRDRINFSGEELCVGFDLGVGLLKTEVEEARRPRLGKLRGWALGCSRNAISASVEYQEYVACARSDLVFKPFSADARLLEELGVLVFSKSCVRGKEIGLTLARYAMAGEGKEQQRIRGKPSENVCQLFQDIGSDWREKSALLRGGKSDYVAVWESGYFDQCLFEIESVVVGTVTQTTNPEILIVLDGHDHGISAGVLRSISGTYVVSTSQCQKSQQHAGTE